MKATLVPDTSGFDWRGQYRVQGSLLQRTSRLQGRLLSPVEAKLLEPSAVNLWLARQPDWKGTFRCRLAAAQVTHREGAFEAEDILYKESHFQPEPGSGQMPCNVVDIGKAQRLWECRSSVVIALVGQRDHHASLAAVGHLPRTIFNEYAVHEAGHGMGWDVDRKAAEAHFCPTGRSEPGLIALEELRADLQGFGAAIDLLDADESRAVFAYNLLLRWGVHLQALHSGKRPPFGLIPFLLHRALREVGFSPTQWRMPPWVDGALALEVMARLADHAYRCITRPQILACDALERAQASARYIHGALSDQKAQAEFFEYFDAARQRL